MHKLCFCTDRFDAPMLARPTNNGKWELFTISEVLVYGNCKYDTKVLEDKFQEITPINSFGGTSYVALRKNDLWALM